MKLDLNLSKPKDERRERAKWIGALIAAPFVWYALVWFLRSLAGPTVLVAGGIYLYWRMRQGRTSWTHKEFIGLGVAIGLVGYFILGPWLLPILRLILVAAFAAGWFLATRKRKAGSSAF